ncbi:hypothetical protein CAC42_2116 [Sphaceloma murrayae]|uniref:Uncharacterized protein n=1 Tax=Sphaceloma murrayae TaxID=2082308 RepID=A0A2K1QIC3_9PEZI|nr:hypothetical protein CAC42_2116 [Sphaceloma murrayae]
MDCFLDFCLGCDNQVTTGFYCSEACRMSDISKSSHPSSPLSHRSGDHTFIFPTTTTTTTTATTTFYQPPSRYPPPPSKSSSSSDLHHPSHSHSKSLPHRVLSPSSSRSSLTSTASSTSTSTPEAEEQTRKELQGYFNAFDRTRDQRRKSLPAFRRGAGSGRSFEGH